MKRFFSPIMAIVLMASPLLFLTSCGVHPTQVQEANKPTAETYENQDPAIVYATVGYPNNVQTGMLWVMNADGSHKTTIYTAPSIPSAISLIGEPTWSPDGKHIAFTRYTSRSGGNCVTQLFTCDLTVIHNMPIMENATQVVSGLQWNMPLAWNPNPADNEIAFTAGTGADTSSAIEVVPATGGNSTILYVAPVGHVVSYPTYSPDGSQLAFEEIDQTLSSQSPKYSIVILDRASKTVQERIALAHVSDPNLLQWSHRAGDTHIAFGATHADGTCGIYTVDAAKPSAAPVQIVTPSAQYCSSSFSWSPDGAVMLIGNISSGQFAHLQLSSGNVSALTSLADGIGQFDWRRF